MKIKHKDFAAEIELNETETAKSIEQALPLKASAQLWGEEVYFEIPIQRGQEKGEETVSPGAVAYWPPGNALCVFFGKTQPVSAVTVVGRIKSGLEKFGEVEQGDAISLDAD